jgi:hypothetical protein
MPERPPDRVDPAADDIVELAKKDARRNGITLSPRTLAAIKNTRGFIEGPRTIRPRRPENESFRSLAVMIPAEWSPTRLLRAHQDLKRALKAGQAVPVRVQYLDGRQGVVVMEPAPWGAAPARPRRRRGGRPRTLTDEVLRESLARAPSLSQAARARRLKVSRATIARRLKRLQEAMP